MLKEKIEALRFYFKLWGLKEGVKFFGGLIKYRNERIYSIERNKESRGLSAIINPNLDFRFIENPEQFDSIISDYAMAKGKLLVLNDRERVVSQKEYIAAMYLKGKFAGWGRVKKGPLVYGTLKLSENECLIHKCITLREHRKQRVYVTMLLRLQEVLAEKGYNRIYITVKSFNAPSIAGIEKAGFRLLGKLDRGSFAFRVLRHLIGRKTEDN